MVEQPFCAHGRLTIFVARGLTVRDAPPFCWDRRRCFQYICSTVARDEVNYIGALDSVRAILTQGEESGCR